MPAEFHGTRCTCSAQKKHPSRGKISSYIPAWDEEQGIYGGRRFHCGHDTGTILFMWSTPEEWAAKRPRGELEGKMRSLQRVQ